MKILHVCESIIGGTGSYLAELIPPQVERYGAENVALLVPETHMDFIEEGIINSGARIITFPRPRRLTGAIFLSGHYLKSIFSFKPDIVHAHSTVAGVVVRVLRIWRTKIIFCPHGWSVDMKGTGRIQKIAEKVERMLARMADRIIVISRHEYDRALELGIPASRLALIPNGIRKEAPSIDPAIWDDDRIKVLYAGRLDYQKGVDVLLKAVEGLDDRLVLRLAGDAAVGSNLLPTTLPAGVEKLGWLDRKEVSAQMKSCDILIVPSRWEGFGLVAIEAMRLGKPVAASTVGGLKDIVDGGNFGYAFPPEDDAALHAFLKTLDKDSLREKGEIGHRRFLATYTSDRMVHQVDEVYSSQFSVVTVAQGELAKNRRQRA
ncbi:MULTISPECIES: glycosyltransferase [unclassified Rhizobium]|uniref:glycosyltransferase n=1 Tax=unclassified Rhizobium TaxID=2613769 RepID=UPI001ADD2F23|nr:MULTISPECIES: glycosyltransferase [unclassified Rhizobium]MBO9099499.1 glycosyltransferase [Rhizobium sp. L58/93]QXZ87019.1 glycosyltransferase [Rhizobium sp. K1/93]QXZ92947.1 glycosyltransferase [Rhizobium sp. K15/93]